MMVIHINDPPTQAGALHIILKTWARRNQLLPILCCKKFKGSV